MFYLSSAYREVTGYWVRVSFLRFYRSITSSIHSPIRRHKSHKCTNRIIAQVSLILSILNLILAVPIVVQEKHEARDDKMVIADDAEAPSDSSTSPQSSPLQESASPHPSSSGSFQIALPAWYCHALEPGTMLPSRRSTFQSGWKGSWENCHTGTAAELIILNHTVATFLMVTDVQ
jgi:hypothetical protein